MRHIVLLCVLLCEGAAWLDLDELNGVSYDVDMSQLPQGLQHVQLHHLPTLSLAQLHHHINTRSRDDEQEAIQVGMTSEYGQKFVCSLPEPAKKEHVGESGTQELSRSVVNDVLAAAFYVRNCVVKNTGWWTYELCHGQYVSQVHFEGNVVVGERISLGNYSADSALPVFEGNREEQLYSEQLYTNGSVCDLNGLPRKTLVQYVCDEALSTHEAYIEHVDERASCEYVLTVRVGSLCTLPPFRAPHTPAAPLEIHCRPVLDTNAVNGYLIQLLHTHNTQVHKQTEVDALAVKAISVKRQILLRDRLHIPSISPLPTQLYHTLTKTVTEINSLLESHSGTALRVHADALTDSVRHFEAGWDSDEDLDRAALYWYWNDPHFYHAFFPISSAYARACNNYYSALSTFYKRFGEQFDYIANPYSQFIEHADNGRVSEVDLSVLVGPLYEVLREDDIPGIVPRQYERDDDYLRQLVHNNAFVHSHFHASLLSNLSQGHSINPTEVMSKCARQLLKLRSVTNARNVNAMSYSQVERIYLDLKNVYVDAVDKLRITSPQLFMARPMQTDDTVRESVVNERSARRRMQDRAKRVGIGRKLDLYFRRVSIESALKSEKGSNKEKLETRMNVLLQHLTEQFKETGITGDEVNIRLITQDEDGRLLSVLDAFLEQQTHLYSEKKRMSDMEDAYSFGASYKTSHSPTHNPSLPILTRI